MDEQRNHQLKALLEKLGWKPCATCGDPPKCNHWKKPGDEFTQNVDNPWETLDSMQWLARQLPMHILIDYQIELDHFLEMRRGPPHWTGLTSGQMWDILMKSAGLGRA